MRRPRTQPATRTTSRRGDGTTIQVTMATVNGKENKVHYDVHYTELWKQPLNKPKHVPEIDASDPIN